jgi:hypothetical protein
MPTLSGIYEWEKDSGWSTIYSYRLLFNGTEIGRVYQGSKSGEWMGFLNKNPLDTIKGNGTLASAKLELIRRASIPSVPPSQPLPEDPPPSSPKP